MPGQAMNDSQFQLKCDSVLESAKSFHSFKPDWVTLFRQILGINGVARETFPETASYQRFEASAQYQLIRKLINDRKAYEPARAPQRTLTVRLPRALHELLKQEALDGDTSMNKLCVAKLIQPVPTGL